VEFFLIFFEFLNIWDFLNTNRNIIAVEFRKAMINLFVDEIGNNKCCVPR